MVAISGYPAATGEREISVSAFSHLLYLMPVHVVVIYVEDLLICVILFHL